jgi:hypothetical protein
VSAPIPQNYVIHTVLIAIVLVVAMLVFLFHQWG